jgi:hypothetical protein
MAAEEAAFDLTTPYFNKKKLLKRGPKSFKAAIMASYRWESGECRLRQTWPLAMPPESLLLRRITWAIPVRFLTLR